MIVTYVYKTRKINQSDPIYLSASAVQWLD